MQSSYWVLLGSCVLTMAVYPQTARQPGTASGTAPASAASARQLLDTYCVTCHNTRAKTGGLALDKIDINQVGENPGVWEKVVRKLRAGMMPPLGMKRPDPATYDGFAGWLETELDRAAVSKPKFLPPGLHRMNRTEYANAVHDILGLEVDQAEFLPVDDSS